MMIAAACLALVGLGTSAHAETWHRADSHHFTIYSNGSASQLEDFTHEVEKFDALLRMIFSRPVKENPAKLTIYLLRNSAAVNAYKQNTVGFYSVRLGQTFAVANRERGSERTDLDGTLVLFHEYAHHFMFHNFAIPAPAWFVEGFAEYVATAEFKRNGEWTFGYPAHHRAWSVQNGPKISIEQLLSEDYSEMNRGETSAFYGWAWALTHMLYSDRDIRGGQITGYLKDISNGMDSLSSARKNFGDLDDLEKRLRRYVRKSMGYAKSDKPIAYRDTISITTLDDESSELRGLILDRLASPEPEKVRDKLARFAATSNSAKAWLELAELEFALAHRNTEDESKHDFTATEAALDRSMALDASLPRAHVLKGRLLLESFDHDENPDEANWAKARTHFIAANHLDSTDPLALYFYAQTYQRSGEAGEFVGPALRDAFNARPESNEFRWALAMQLAEEKQYDVAIGLLKIVANNPHFDNSSAKNAIKRMESARARGETLTAGAIATEKNDDVENESGDEG